VNLEALVKLARARGASDLHVEAAQPVVARVCGELERIGDPPSAIETLNAAKSVLSEEHWQRLLARRSFDFSRSLGGVRCRINVLATVHGVGFAVRLLTHSTPTLDSLNLLPDLRELVKHTHGLVVVCGPTGSGKSSTLAAMIQEINLTSRRHVIAVEEPIEYALRSQRAFIRQREVGTHTPSFQQALIDALREDPDVMMVGEMRHPEVMRLTLNFAETGHLVFATVHAANCAEAVQRIAMSFPPESQTVVCAQLANSLLAVIAQRLVYRAELRMRVPECEILTNSPAARNLVRQGQFHKIESALATGARDGMYTWERYRQWMEGRPRWSPQSDRDLLEEPADPAAELPLAASAQSLPTPLPTVPSAEAEGEVMTLEAPAETLSEFVSRLKPTAAP
jgi:twitching motility protein PilT